MTAGILGIIGAVLPFLIKVLTFYFEKSQMDDVVRKRFLDFIESLESSMKVPSDLRKDYKKQGDRLRERMKRELGE